MPKLWIFTAKDNLVHLLPAAKHGAKHLYWLKIQAPAEEWQALGSTTYKPKVCTIYQITMSSLAQF